MIDRIQRLAFRLQPPRHIVRHVQRKREAADREFERYLREAMKNVSRKDVIRYGR